MIEHRDDDTCKHALTGTDPILVGLEVVQDRREVTPVSQRPLQGLEATEEGVTFA